MKRGIIAVLLAALLAAAGVCSQLWYGGVSREMAGMLDEVMRLVDSGELEGADEAMERLYLYIEQKHGVMNMTGEHGEVDSLCEAAVKARAMLKVRDMTDFAAEAAELARIISHMYEREKLSLDNLL